jgi:hypothetical protein
MILRNAALLLLAPLASGYLADVNNAHIQLLNEAPEQPSFESSGPELEVLLQNKLWGSHTPASILSEFEAWIEKFERKYESLSEKGQRLLVWLENHGA